MPTPESGKHSMILEMFLFEFNHYTVLATVLTSVLSVLLLLTATRQLWTLRWTMTRDRDSPLPLPKGSMGWPLFGETFHWLLQGSRFHISRREKHGNVFKTHLLGKPVIRVTGAENIRKILLGEHNLVSTQWPQSTRIILGAHTLVNSVGDLHKQKRKILTKVFSRAALETYVPRLQDVVRAEVAKWCSDPGSINAYTSAKALTFRIAVRVLLGLRIDERRFNYLSKTFEQLMDNLFSLPLDVPFSGLRKGMKARDILHECMEKIIEEKLQKKQTEEHSDIFDYMLGSAKENGYEISMQELKESAVELIFAAHSTTASASTSLILQLLRHPSVAETAKAELETQGLNWGIHRPQCPACKERSSSQAPESKEEPTTNGKHGDWSLRTDTAVQKTLNDNMGAGYCDSEGENFCRHSHYLSLEKLSGLRYLDCVVKEVLRFLPPVSGGYRTVLRTFELQGYQIPKGWSVMYSIRDTHETAAVFERPEMFDPERFGPERDESKAGSRFSFIPFGGGIRSCIGRELAQIILKTLAVELLNTAKWELATATFPKMQTVPIVHPVNGLHLYFSFLDSDARKTTPQE